MAKLRHVLLHRMQPQHHLARGLLAEDLGLDGFQLFFQVIHDGDEAVHHGVSQRIQHEDGPLLQQLHLAFGPGPHIRETAPDVVADGEHEAWIDEDVKIAVMDLAVILFGHLHRDEQHPVVFLDLGALAAVQRVLHRQLGQVQDLLQHQDLGRYRVLQRNPGESLAAGQHVGQFVDGDVGLALAVGVDGTVDHHGGLVLGVPERGRRLFERCRRNRYHCAMVSGSRRSMGKARYIPSPPPSVAVFSPAFYVVASCCRAACS